jgi:hypothetical protein
MQQVKLFSWTNRAADVSQAQDQINKWLSESQGKFVVTGKHLRGTGSIFCLLFFYEPVMAPRDDTH